MKYLIWLLRVIVFVMLLGFAIKNSGGVTVRFFFDADWQLPLVAVMLIFFAAGAAVGVTAALGSYLRQRREILALKRQAARSSSGAP
ncbi:MAG: LapA family protein [Betaproteobacteria bacterium]|nr:LapA family protein [Betaproteobacteria bacterium]